MIATAALACVYRQFVFFTRETACNRCINSSNNNIFYYPHNRLFINKKSRDIVTASPSSAATLIDELNNRLPGITIPVIERLIELLLLMPHQRHVRDCKGLFSDAAIVQRKRAFHSSNHMNQFTFCLIISNHSRWPHEHAHIL